ncbi:MAG: hypothetical protein KKE44_05430 [Proteobacteria bacterium]|nr:hypothetical protein [Pseudomonadota bacterium]MBU1582175.1 hypothetical protein [Pseudomonadota bacterium]MBU2452990.1 hypothetical protein [Pseudomonadota bacterium]MBU2628699.1 hypothetical protein [Pseudomonadota bacterium]
MKFSDLKIIEKSFSWIKNQLDPAMGYVIFENNLNKQPLSLFSESLTAYLKKAGYAFKMVFDAQQAKEYLVIQVDPGNEDEILGKVMGYGLPKDTVSYLYKAKPHDKE